jgi:membrane-bound metal-dependent hydrolase YbcI (DUF457 family)
MTPVSHALLPVFFGQRWIPKNGKIPSVRFVSLVALCGALPDILSPHLSLDARYTALSHTVWALCLFAILIGVMAWFLPKTFSGPIALLCIIAYGGHLACDAITGGISALYPFSNDVQGRNYLPYWLWITSDGLLILYFYLVYRWLPLRRKMKERQAAPYHDRSRESGISETVENDPSSDHRSAVRKNARRG